MGSSLFFKAPLQILQTEHPSMKNLDRIQTLLHFSDTWSKGNQGFHSYQKEFLPLNIQTLQNWFQVFF